MRLTLELCDAFDPHDALAAQRVFRMSALHPHLVIAAHVATSCLPTLFLSQPALPGISGTVSITAASILVRGQYGYPGRAFS